MRILFALPLLAIALPAAARDRTPPPSDSTARAAAALADPRVQDGVATLINRFSDIILDTRVGPAASFVDPSIRPNDTARDALRRDDPAFDQKLHDRTRSTVATAGRAAGAGLQFSKEIDRTVDRLGALIDSVEAPTTR